MPTVEAFVVHFWPILLLALLRPILGLLTATAFAAVRSSVDRIFPHNLPVTTGEWLREQVAKRGLRGEIEVFTSTNDPNGVDAFFPGSSFIQLAPETYLRTDPVGWATGAHELGHALNYRRTPWLHAMLVCARWSSRGTLWVATAMMLANLLYGSALVAQLVFGLLLVATVMNTLVLWDELWASQLGVKLLREDGRLQPWHLDGAIITMGAAFLSYASGLVGTIAVLIGYSRVADLTVNHAPFAHGEPLSGPSLYIAGALSIALIGRAIAEVYRFFVPSRYESAAHAEVSMTMRGLLDTGWTIPLVAFVAMVWDQPLGPLFTVALMFAALPCIQTFLRVISPMLPVVMLPVFMLLMPLMGMVVQVRPIEDDPAIVPGDDAIAAMRAEMERGHVELRAAQLRLVNDPPMYMRVGGLVRVAYVPAVLLFWWLRT